MQRLFLIVMLTKKTGELKSLAKKNAADGDTQQLQNQIKLDGFEEEVKPETVDEYEAEIELLGRRSKKAKSFKLQPAFRQTEKEEVHRSEPEDDESDKENKTAEKIRKNLMSIFAMKAYSLSGKVRLLGCGSIREKISLYLIENQTPSGEIAKNPSREELADYLNVTRPSLSRELGNMEKEGIIRLEGRKIIIVSQEKLEEYL